MLKYFIPILCGIAITAANAIFSNSWTGGLAGSLLYEQHRNGLSRYNHKAWRGRPLDARELAKSDDLHYSHCGFFGPIVGFEREYSLSLSAKKEIGSTKEGAIPLRLEGRDVVTHEFLFFNQQKKQYDWYRINLSWQRLERLNAFRKWDRTLETDCWGTIDPLTITPECKKEIQASMYRMAALLDLRGLNQSTVKPSMVQEFASEKAD